jgi:hypothetical protein
VPEKKNQFEIIIIAKKKDNNPLDYSSVMKKKNKKMKPGNKKDTEQLDYVTHPVQLLNLSRIKKKQSDLIKKKKKKTTVMISKN